jgi:hypothetical protein
LLFAGFPLALSGNLQVQITQGPTAEDFFAQPSRIEDKEKFATRFVH